MSIGLAWGRGFVCEDMTVVIAEEYDLASTAFEEANLG